MFERLELITADTILSLMAAFRADPDPRKVDLGVGVYRDDRGETPIPAAVRQAESVLLARQTTKTYVGPAGNLGFNQEMASLVLGREHEALVANRVRTIQCPGGCGALRLGAELIRYASPESVVHVSDPTWVNHVPLLSGSGLKLERYPYYDPASGGVRSEMGISRMAVPDVRMYASAIFATASRPRDEAGAFRPISVSSFRSGAESAPC